MGAGGFRVTAGANTDVTLCLAEGQSPAQQARVDPFVLRGQLEHPVGACECAQYGLLYGFLYVASQENEQVARDRRAGDVGPRGKSSRTLDID